MKEIIILAIIGLTTIMVTPSNTVTPQKTENMKLNITVNNQQFTATLNSSEAAKEFIKLLPLEVNMTEHNGNEKFYNLPNRMPGRATSPGRVEAGDLMIWSSNTLVLFYAGARTSYSYISLGKIDNPEGLQQAVGRGSARVNFELEQE